MPKTRTKRGRTTMKTDRLTLDRIRPYATFGDSWNTALNKAFDILDDLLREKTI